MPKVSPMQTDFSGGEVSPYFQGRVESDQYRISVGTLLNYVPTVQGGATRRPGTKFVSEVEDSTKATRLIPFRFSTEQAYAIEVGDLYLRFYKDNGQILLTAKTITGVTQANPAVATSAAHGFANGDEVFISGVVGMTELNGRNFKVAGVTANTFQLQYLDGTAVNSSAFTAYSSGGTAEEVYTLVTTYAAADIFGLRFTQSADVLYIAHKNYATRKLTRTGHTSWTLTTVSLLDGPYLPVAGDRTVTVTQSGAGPYTYTFTASVVDTFVAGDVGRKIRWKVGTTWHSLDIAAFTSGTIVTATSTVAITDQSNATFRLGVFYAGNYPANVVFHEDRLCLGGSPDYPQRIDGSNVGDYENFAPSDDQGVVTSANAISFTMNANEVNASRWLTSDEKGLLSGSTGAEWVVRPSSQGEALSPTNVAAKKATSYGAAEVAPLQVGKATLFIQKSSRKMREFIYFYDVDGFQSNDLTFLAEHVLQSGAVEMAYQGEPQPIVWVVREDGVLAAMTYARDPDSLKVGWSRHILGGASDAAGNPAKVESVTVIPAADESYDELWMIVKRYIGGRTVRCVEYLGAFFEDSMDQSDACMLDSSLTLDSPVTITAATAANPVAITAASHGLSNGDTLVISEIEGMTELNGNIYTAANVTANTFELSGVNGTAFTTYVTGGEVRKRVSTVSGLWHLEGQTVSIFGDGAVQPNKTVASGAITLATPAAVVHVGYGYNSDMQLLRIEAGSAEGASLGKTRRIHILGLLLHRTLGMKIGTSFDELTPINFRTTADEMGHAPELYTGIVLEELDADYNFENLISIRQDQPTPGTILAVMPQMATQDR